MSNELENLLWIELPADVETDIGVFSLDPSIPLPIEAEDGVQSDMGAITWEKLVSAMLLLLANHPSYEHANYYRQLLKAIRPQLEAELEEASERCITNFDWENAEDILLALRGLSPDSVRHRLSSARFYHRKWLDLYNNGNMETADQYGEAAEAAYKELLSDDLVPPETKFYAGMFRYKRGDFLRACEILESYVDENPEKEKKKEAESVIHLCRLGGQTDRLYLDAYHAIQEEKIDDGIRMAREFLEKKSDSWPGFFLLGWGLRLRGEWPEARKTLEKAEKMGCRENSLYNEIAICTREMGDLKATEKALESALRLNPESIKTITNMAVVLKDQGREEDAFRWLQSALTLAPEDPVCKLLKNRWNIH